jgi:hypothetical protein
LSVSALLIALEPSGHPLRRLGLAAAGLLIGAVFLRQQRDPGARLLPLEYLRDRTVQAGLIGGGIAGALLYATTAYVPLWMTSHGYSALLAGLALVPMLAGWAVGSALGVEVLIRGGMRASVGGGFALSAVGALFLALAVVTSAHVGWVFLALAVMGLGLGPAASTATIGPQSVVPWSARSVVTSAVYSTRMLGGAIAISLLDLFRGAPALQVVLVAPICVLGGVLLLALAPGGRMAEHIDPLELAMVE